MNASQRALLLLLLALMAGACRRRGCAYRLQHLLQHFSWGIHAASIRRKSVGLALAGARGG